MGAGELARRLLWRRLSRSAARVSRPLGSHRNGQIVNYQCVVPSTWNAGPRDSCEPAGSLRGGARRHSGGEAGSTTRNTAHGALVRSVHGVRSARGGCQEARAGSRAGRCERAPEIVGTAERGPGIRLGVAGSLNALAHFLFDPVLSATGFYIGHPFIAVSGPARDHFVMGTMRVIHLYTAIVFSLAVLFRIYWMFVGNRYARWDQYHSRVG